MDRVWRYVTGWEIPSYVSASKENSHCPPGMWWKSIKQVIRSNDYKRIWMDEKLKIQAW